MYTATDFTLEISKYPVLETERLLLTKLKNEHAHDMFEYASRREVTEYLTWSPHGSEALTARYIKSRRFPYFNGTYHDRAMILKSTGKMIGTCGPVRIDCDNLTAELGYALNPDYMHNGYMTEAVTEIIRHVSLFGFKRIEARYIIGNDASRAVMDRCGMKFEGILRKSLTVKGRLTDIGVCALILP